MSSPRLPARQPSEVTPPSEATGLGEHGTLSAWGGSAEEHTERYT